MCLLNAHDYTRRLSSYFLLSIIYAVFHSGHVHDFLTPFSSCFFLNPVYLESCLLNPNVVCIRVLSSILHAFLLNIDDNRIATPRKRALGRSYALCCRFLIATLDMFCRGVTKLLP